uniref:VIgL family C1q-related protein 14 n=1 Tax=Littorina littorea TaxID=31216 RepID=A0A411DEM8_LITLI|nr:VIgL family C1q-related protein 14 [Littorina littorea]
MAFSTLNVLAVICIFACGTVRSFEWDTVPDPVVYACAGKTATFPWSFRARPEVMLTDIHWVFEGSFVSEILASLTHNIFLPNPTFSPRLSHVTPAGLIMRDVTMADEGKYTVEVNVVEEGSYVTHRHSVYMQVGDKLMTRDGTLKAKQDPLWDDTKDQWVIRLTCGFFTFSGQPPIYVEWTTPAGDTTQSKDYSNGHFHLTLPPPVEGGNYTCSIPEQFLPDVCVSDGRHGNKAVAASVLVDETKVRLTLLEVGHRVFEEENRVIKEGYRVIKEENIVLKEEMNDTQTQMASLTHYVDAQNEHLTHYVDSKDENMTQYVDAHSEEVMTNVRRFEDKMAESVEMLESDLSLLSFSFNETSEKSRVQFYARYLPKSCYSKGEALTFDDTLTNHGEHFNASTGFFTVPYNGTYAFLATIGSWDRSGEYSAEVYLIVDETRVAFGFAGYPQGGNWRMTSFNAVVRLTTNQKISLKASPRKKSCFWSFVVSFTGFLLTFDP